jgi:hypothetical protein
MADATQTAGPQRAVILSYARLLRDPGGILSNYSRKFDTFCKLHGDPRLEALVDDPASNAPLF